MSVLVSLALLVGPPTPAPEPTSAPAPSLPDVDDDPDDVTAPDAPADDPGFFAPDSLDDADAPPLDAPTGEAASGVPPMPPIEELPSRDSSQPEPGSATPKRRKVIDWDPNAAPAGSDGGSFFDPGKLADTGPAGGTILQIRGYVSSAFLMTERTNTRERTSEGTFERVAPLPFFGASVATLYFGAAIWADAVYARISIEYLSIPRITAGTEDILAPARRELLVESAALEINPFVWAKQTPRWFREGFKITAGVFIVPFGIEDEEHATPISWFTTRPRVMTNGRVYPGTWSDLGAMIQFKPTFREHNPIRPIELTLGVVNGDPCTQTRFADALYSPTGLVANCERVRRPEELLGSMTGAELGSDPRADIGFLGIGPDNNRNKGFIARASLFPLPTLQFGGSLAWGKHPRLLDLQERMQGKTTIDVPQAVSWRAGAHLDIDFDQIFSSPYPLPMIRGEFVIGTDAAPAPREGELQPYADRHVIGAYGQIAQPLYRRKRSNLPGLMIQYRVDWSDPDRAVPGIVRDPDQEPVALPSDPSDGYLYDEAQIGHTIGLRWLVVPRFSIKADYSIIREDGGIENQLYNDRFVFQVVGDF